MPAYGSGGFEMKEWFYEKRRYREANNSDMDGVGRVEKLVAGREKNEFFNQTFPLTS